MTAPDRAASVVLDGSGAVLVVHRSRVGRHYCVLPGGGVEAGEDGPTAAIRELREETGLEGRVMRLIGSIDHEDRRAHYYLVSLDPLVPRSAVLRLGGPEIDRQSALDRHCPGWLSVSDLDVADLQPVGVRDLVRAVGR